MKIAVIPPNAPATQANIEFRTLPDLDGSERVDEIVYGEMRKIVDGYVEIVRFQPPLEIDDVRVVFVVNDQADIKDLPINYAGSALYGVREHGDWVYGTIVVVREHIVNEEPNFLGLPEDMTEEQLRAVMTKYILERGY